MNIKVKENNKLKLHHCICIKEEEHNYTGKDHRHCDELVVAGKGVEWGDTDTEFLLSKYEQFINLVGPMRRFKRKKHLWMQISSDFEEELEMVRTALQCENRYKTILKRKKKPIDNNNSRIEIPFDEEMVDISTMTDTITSDAPISPNEDIYDEPESKKHRNSDDALLEFLKEKEVAKERRHQEKLAMIAKLIKTIARSIDK